MEIQMKKGLLDVCVLACLERGDSYGYQLVADLSPVIEISESTLYPILKRLETQGLLTTYSREYGGRLRKYYRITPAGHVRVEGFKNDWEELVRINAFIQGGRK